MVYPAASTRGEVEVVMLQSAAVAVAVAVAVVVAGHVCACHQQLDSVA